jgi:hypothetical protein
LGLAYSVQLAAVKKVAGGVHVNYQRAQPHAYVRQPGLDVFGSNARALPPIDERLVRAGTLRHELSSNGSCPLINRRCFTIWLAAASAACRESERQPHGIDKVFSGFEFAGEFPATDVDLKSRSHEKARLPRSFVVGPQYIFHLEEDGDFDEIPAGLLPNRLRSAGATVIYAPSSWRDMGIPNTGNPIWDIEFLQGIHRDHIRNRLDWKRLERFAPQSPKMRHNRPDPRIDDYILSFSV